MIVQSNKPDRDVVGTAMRQRLMSNRDGRLFRGQWMSLITEPIIVGLMLLSPAIVVLGPRLKYLFTLNLWFLLIVLVLLIGVPAYRRARRYMAAPMKFAVLHSPDRLRSPLMFWKEDEFLTDDARLVRFRHRLAPSMTLVPGQPYLVYYLEERGKNILLSLAPADHSQAKFWYPTPAFKRRHRA